MSIRQRKYWDSHLSRKHPSDRVVAAFASPKVELMRRYITKRDNLTILDVGCGNGYYTYYLEQLGQVHAVDLSRIMISQNPSGTLLEASALGLPFADESFDLTFCSNLLHHISSPSLVIQEMKRVSANYVVIIEPNRNNPMMMALGLVKHEERLLLRFTRKYAEKLAKQAGLRIIYSETSGFVTPNRMPRTLVNLTRATKIDGAHPLGAYNIVICEKH